MHHDALRRGTGPPGQVECDRFAADSRRRARDAGPSASDTRCGESRLPSWATPGKSSAIMSGGPIAPPSPSTATTHRLPSVTNAMCVPLGDHTGPPLSRFPAECRGNSTDGRPRAGLEGIEQQLVQLGGGLVARPMALRLRSRPSLRPGRWAIHSYLRDTSSVDLASFRAAGGRSCLLRRQQDRRRPPACRRCRRYHDGPRPGTPNRLADSRLDRAALRDRRGTGVVGRTTWCDFPAAAAGGARSGRWHQSQHRGDARHPAGSRRALQVRATTPPSPHGSGSSASPALRLNTDGWATSAASARLLGPR